MDFSVNKNNKDDVDFNFIVWFMLLTSSCDKRLKKQTPQIFLNRWILQVVLDYRCQQTVIWSLWASSLQKSTLRHFFLVFAFDKRSFLLFRCFYFFLNRARLNLHHHGALRRRCSETGKLCHVKAFARSVGLFTWFGSPLLLDSTF